MKKFTFAPPASWNTKNRDYTNVWTGITGLLITIVGLCWVGSFILQHIEFRVNCTGYLERAAYANTTESAAKELDIALSYIEENQWTSGWTYIFIRSPSTDMGFWYNNLKVSRDELKALPTDATQLERSNMLLKLRESIVEHSAKGGESIRRPNHLPFYPRPGFWVFLQICSIFVVCLGVMLILGRWTKVVDAAVIVSISGILIAMLLPSLI